jgi:hypothetical protein
MDEGFYVPGTDHLWKLTVPQIEALQKHLYRIVAVNQPATVRGGFYLAETMGLVPKTQAGYDRIQNQLLNMRRQDKLPWNWIVDLGRDVYSRDTYDSLSDFLDDMSSLYARDHWRTHDHRVEVWLEKRAVSGVIRPVVIGKWGLDLYISVGQSSDTYLHRAGETIKRYGKPTHVLILTDLDPSGISIDDNIARKLPLFTGGVPVFTRRLAVTRDQVRELNLPTRPPKETGKQKEKFNRQHGDDCVELDAIPPPVLRQLVDEAIAPHADMRKIRHERMIQREERNFLKNLIPGRDGNIPDDDFFPPGFDPSNPEGYVGGP